MFAEQMIERGTGGHIVNVSSAAAFMPQKRIAAYATSKAAVLMLSDCLRAELLENGIGVTAVCPSLVSTNFNRSIEFVETDPETAKARRSRTSAMYRKLGGTARTCRECHGLGGASQSADRDGRAGGEGPQVDQPARPARDACRVEIRDRLTRTAANRHALEASQFRNQVVAVVPRSSTTYMP